MAPAIGANRRGGMVETRVWLNRWRAALRRRLWRPMLHATHPPEYTARGAAVGLFVAFTPTVGVQIVACLALWSAVRWFKREWDFNLVLACAWTFVTNVFTAPPIYWAFVQTGRLMLGEWDRLRGYDAFVGKIESVLGEDLGWAQSLWGQAVHLVETFGVPMVIGSLPWATAAAWIGYRWTLRVVRHRRAMRAGRRQMAHSRRQAEQRNRVL